MGEITTKIRTPQRLRFAYSAPDSFGAVDHYQLRLVRDPEAKVLQPEALEPTGSVQLDTSQVTLKASEPESVWGETAVASRFRLYDADTGDEVYTKETDELATEVQVPAQPESQPYAVRPWPLSPAGGKGTPHPPTLTATSPRVAHDTGSFDVARWQVFADGADPSTDSPLYDSGEVTDLEAHDVPEGSFDPGTIQWRVQQHDVSYGWSEWSALTGTVESVYPQAETPTAQGPSGESWTEYPTLQGSAYSSNVDEEPVASRFRFYDADTGDLIYDSGEIEYTTSHAVPHSTLPSNYRG